MAVQAGLVAPLGGARGEVTAQGVGGEGEGVGGGAEEAHESEASGGTQEGEGENGGRQAGLHCQGLFYPGSLPGIQGGLRNYSYSVFTLRLLITHKNSAFCLE